MDIPPQPPEHQAPAADPLLPIPEPSEIAWIRYLALGGAGVSIIWGSLSGILTGGCCILWIFHLGIGIYGLTAGIEAQSRRKLPPPQLAILYMLCIITLDLVTFSAGLVMGLLQRKPAVLDWRYREAMRRADHPG